MANLLKALQPLAAIAGGTATGLLQARQAQQEQDERNLLQAMRMATTRSGLQTDELQRQALRQEIGGYEDPVTRRRREYQDWLARQQQTRDWSAEDAAAERARVAAAEARYREGLLDIVPRPHTIERNLPAMVPPPMGQEPGLLSLMPQPRGMAAFEQRVGERLTPDAIPPRTTRTETTLPPRNPLFAGLRAANIPVAGTTMSSTGDVLPVVGEIPTDLQLRQQRADLRRAETEATYAEPKARLALALDEAGLRRTDAEIDRLVADAERIRNEDARIDEDAALMEAGYRDAVARGDIEMARFYETRRFGGTWNTSALSPESQAIKLREQDLGIARLESNERIAEMNARVRQAIAELSARTRLSIANAQLAMQGERLNFDYLKETGQLSAETGGYTPAQRKAAEQGFDLIQQLASPKTTDAALSPEIVAHELAALAKQAGPLGRDLVQAFHAAYMRDWRAAPVGTEAPGWENVDWARLYTSIGLRAPGRMDVAPPRGGAAPLPQQSGAGSRPVVQTTVGAPASM